VKGSGFRVYMHMVAIDLINRVWYLQDRLESVFFFAFFPICARVFVICMC
jgi:hypothetical protein